MIKEIQAKSILNTNKHPSQWFGVNYNMNIYRGCSHQCIYCDSRSACYRVENFDEDIIVKINAPQLLEGALIKKRKRGTIGTGAMSDPYIPIEKDYQLTRRCLEIVDAYRYRVNIVTKSNLILRDIDILERIAKRYASVAITVTTTDDTLAKIIEPEAPLPSERLKTIGILAEVGVNVGITMMPQLPYIMETREHITNIIQQASHYGAQFIVPSFGVTLRDRQREYYYQQLTKIEKYKNLPNKYRKRYKGGYYAGCVNYKKLKAEFLKLCKENNIETTMPSYEKKSSVTQLMLPIDPL